MAANHDRPESLTSFLVLWTGQALSILGSMAAQLALIWWLTRATGSAAVLATATLLGLLPTVVLGPVIGVLVDRWDRKRIMLAADGLVAALRPGDTWNTSRTGLPSAAGAARRTSIGRPFSSSRNSIGVVPRP